MRPSRCWFGLEVLMMAAIASHRTQSQFAALGQSAAAIDCGGILFGTRQAGPVKPNDCGQLSLPDELIERAAFSCDGLFSLGIVDWAGLACIVDTPFCEPTR